MTCGEKNNLQLPLGLSLYKRTLKVNSTDLPFYIHFSLDIKTCITKINMMAQIDRLRTEKGGVGSLVVSSTDLSCCIGTRFTFVQVHQK